MSDAIKLSLWTLISLGLLCILGCGAGTASSPGASQSGAGQAVAARLQEPVALASVGPFTVNLNAGWNGVGLQSDTVTSLSASSSIVGYATWDGTRYNISSFLNTANLNAGEGTRRGMWVFANAATSFSYSGTSATQTSTNLHDGWNLLAFPMVDAGLPGAALTCRRSGSVVPLNSALLTQFYEIGPDNAYTVVDVSGSGLVRPGRAYWIYALDAVALSYDSSNPSPSPSPGSSPVSSPGASPTPAGSPTPVASPSPGSSPLPSPAGSPGPAGPPPVLGTTSTFVILAGSTVTSTGESRITGDIGIFPGSAITGFPPATFTGILHAGDAVAQQAQQDLTTAFNEATARAGAPVTVAGNLGGQTLAPALYKSTSSLAVSSGDLTLDAGGNADAVFIFQMASTLTVTSGRTVILTNGAKANNVFWAVGSSATFGTNCSFSGNLLVDQSISMATGATLTGRALTRIGAVTMESNTLVKPAP